VSRLSRRARLFIGTTLRFPCAEALPPTVGSPPRSGSAAGQRHRVASGVHALWRTSGTRGGAHDTSTTRYGCMRDTASRLAPNQRRGFCPTALRPTRGWPLLAGGRWCRSLRTRRGVRGLHGVRGSARWASTIAITSTATRGRERAVVPTLPRIVHLPRLTSPAGNAYPQGWPTAVVAVDHGSTSCRSRSREVCSSKTLDAHCYDSEEAGDRRGNRRDA